MNSLKNSIIIPAYAKINLTLDVLHPELNGYHKLMSVMQTIDLHDKISIKKEHYYIYLSCNVPYIPVNSTNLVYKAAELFYRHTGLRPEANIHIDKHIPVQAGLGGGSSDAAATLMGLNSLYGNIVGTDELNKIAAKIGSDVPFFLVGGTALVSGFGEHVELLPLLPKIQIAIVKPSFGISTRWAYNRLDEMRSAGVAQNTDKSEKMVDLIRSNDYEHLYNYMHNDLELPSIEAHPKIAEIKSAMMNTGAAASLMCGSGSAVFGVYPNGLDSADVTDALGKFGKVYITSSLGQNEGL